MKICRIFPSQFQINQPQNMKVIYEPNFTLPPSNYGIYFNFSILIQKHPKKIKSIQSFLAHQIKIEFPPSKNRQLRKSLVMQNKVEQGF
jgi:hypothetical protein